MTINQLEKLTMNKLITLTNKIHKSFANANTPTEVYSQIRANKFISHLFLDGRLNGMDLILLCFLINYKNKGVSPEKIYPIIKSNLIAVNIFEVGDENPETDCPECGGESNSSCGDCFGEGEYNCRNCDGTGETDCDECGGYGEDDEGNSCSECQGGGNVTCDDCNGSGTEECDWCDGTGSVDCPECDGVGYITNYGFNSIQSYDIICVTSSLKDFFETKDIDTKVSPTFFENLKSQQGVLICKVDDDISDEVSEFEDGDVLIRKISSEPTIYLDIAASNRISISY